MTDKERAQLYGKLVYCWLLCRHREVHPPRERVSAGPSTLSRLLSQSERWIAVHMPRVVASMPRRMVTVRFANGRLESELASPTASRTEAVQEVFEYWKKVMDKPRAKLTPKRSRMIAARLADYDVKALCMAVDGCARSPFHMGDNDRQTQYNTPENIFGSERTVDQHMSRAHAPCGISDDAMTRLMLINGGRK